MKIALLEPIGIPEELVGNYGKALEDQGHTFCYYDTVTTDPEELKRRSEGCDIVMIANHPYPEEVIRTQKQLKMISVAFTGIDHVGTKACKEQSIMVCNAAGYSDQTVAELVIGFAIDALRKIPEADRQVRALQGSAGLMGRELCGKTVGIIGLGKIGLRTAKLFQAFGCRVIAYNRSESEEAKQMGISYLPLEEVLSQSDILSVHLPLNNATRGFLGESQLKLMKPSAVLINCARGPVVDEAAIVKALSENRLGYTCVDVFDKEPPLPAEQPLLHAERALLTPHVGYLSEESMVRRAKIVFDNVQSFLDGKPQNVCKI